MNDKKKKILFAIVKVIFVLLMITFVIFLAFAKTSKHGINIHIFSEPEKEMVMKDYFEVSDYIDTLKKKKSDIKGMTNYDKLKLGLDPTNGSDSDMDGLTDKEEIEIYKTDPTKASTSGDLYQDGYKVKHHMDLKKSYEYKDDLSFSDNHCKEFILKATSAADFNACVNDFTGSNMYNLSDKDVLKTYSVFCYSGQVTINLSKIDDNLKAEDITVYVQNYYEQEAKIVKFSTDKDHITLTKLFDYDIPYIIYLVKEKSTLAKRFTSAVIGNDVTFGSLLDEEGIPKSSYGIVYGMFTDLKIKYVETSNEKLNKKTRNHLIAVANDILMERHSEISESNISVASKAEVDRIVNISRKLPKIKSVICENHGKADSLDSYGVLYTYYIYDGEPLADFAKKDKNDTSTHVFCEDILPFGNFGTSFSPNGVCAGIAHLTSSLHNNGTLADPKGSFEHNGKMYSWDITKDPENKTLLDKGLYDYKDSDFVKNHMDDKGLVTKGLSEGEKDFINLVNYYLVKGNNAFSVQEYAKGIDGKDAGKDAWTMFFYDGTVIRNTIKELNKGHIVDAYFLFDSSGHTVNIIGYEKAKTNLLNKDTSGYVFYVYDSNHPNVLGTLSCEIYKHKNGMEHLIYSLNIPGASYSAHSGGSLETKYGRISLFVVLDSNFKVLN